MSGVVSAYKETAMETNASVTQMGLDVHRKFSLCSARDGVSGRIVRRERLEHADRNAELAPVA